MVAMGLWGIRIGPDTPYTTRLLEVVLITNVALSDQLQDPEGRTSVRINVSMDSKHETSFVLCSLTPGKVEHCSVNLTLMTESTYTFEVVGPNSVYLSGNYIGRALAVTVLDDFGAIRALRDAVLQDTVKTARRAGWPEDSEGSIAVVDQTGAPPTTNIKKRRRTSVGEMSGGDAAAKPQNKGKEVESSIPKPEGVQWIDSGPSGKGDTSILWGDEVYLKYKMVTGHAVPVADNISGDPLHFVVGDKSAPIPQAVHFALVGMKLKAQRIVRVSLESAQKDPGLGAFLKPAQAYRIDLFVYAFNPAQSMPSKA